MQRREFLVHGGQAVLGLSVAPSLPGLQQRAAPAQDDAWTVLLGDLDREIVDLMQQAQVPGLSIALIRNGTLAWRKGFGVKDIRSRAPVDERTVFEAASTSSRCLPTP